MGSGSTLTSSRLSIPTAALVSLFVCAQARTGYALEFVRAIPEKTKQAEKGELAKALSLILPGAGGGAGQLDKCAACDVGLVECGDSVRGTLSDNDCRLAFDNSLVDVWRLGIANTSLVTIEYKSTDFDAFLMLLNASCEQIDFNNNCPDGEGSTDSCLTVQLTPGLYFLMANTSVAGLSGDYNLSVTCVDEQALCEGDCVEDSIECGQEVSGTLVDDDCLLHVDKSRLDVYTFDLETSTNVEIELESVAFDPYLWVFDPTCAAVAQNNDCEPGVTMNSCLTLNLGAGRWSVGVNSLFPTGRGDYTLRIKSCSEPISICEGCVVGQAICDGVNIGELPTSDCQFSGNRPFDVWFLDLETESDVRIELRSDNFDPNLFVTDLECEIDVNNDDCDGGGLDSCLTLPNLQPGRYAIVAAAFRAGTSGQYELEVQASECSSERPCQTCPGEPVDCERGTIQGELPADSCMLDRAGRVVYHELVVPSESSMTIRLEAEYDTLLTILNSNCEEIDRNDDCSTPAGTLNSCLEVNLHAGRYYIGAASLFGSDNGPYTLTIECGDAAPNILAGDCDASGRVDLADAICLFNFLFLGGQVEVSLPCSDGTLASPANRELMNWNADDDVNLTDGIGMLNYLFLGGSPHALGLDNCVNIASCPVRCAE